MHWNFNATLEAFHAHRRLPLLKQGLFGFEKENLRVDPEGKLALTPHPRRLGSSLTHPHITTDFSESQIEMITPPFPTMEEAFHHLHDLEKEVVEALENGERLWPLSMPCRLPSVEQIPIARYGDSPDAKRRETYREGLAQRYGKTMQMVSGMHYNFSFTEGFWKFLKVGPNEGYLHLVRNFLRERWKLVYLFAASPLKDPSYSCRSMKGSPEAISLRLSRCGYTNPAKVDISYNDYDTHVADIRRAVDTPYPPYADLHPQLNDHLLQIANEFYAPIRLKPPKLLNNDLLHSLETLGAGYVEVRILDLNPFTPCGITLQQGRLLHLFLVACALNPSPPMSESERLSLNEQQETIALHGRNLSENDRQEILQSLNGLRPLAQAMDANEPSTSGYETTLDHYELETREPRTLPWKQMVDTIEPTEDDFLKFGLEKAVLYTQKHLPAS